jgi:SAM-dependent methyltransferase
MKTTGTELWKRFYGNGVDAGRKFSYPSELLVSMLLGPYLKNVGHELRRKRVLEVGFGNANNLLFLGSLGMQLHGTEIEPSICQQAAELLQSLNLEHILKVGQNSDLPFDDNYFDILVSWNVLHYEQSSFDLQQAISEYARVLRTGGRLLLSTVAPESSFLREAIHLEDGVIEMRNSGDFRYGLKFRVIADAFEAHQLFSKNFDELSVGRTTTTWGEYNQDSFLITGVRK